LDFFWPLAMTVSFENCGWGRVKASGLETIGSPSQRWARSKCALFCAFALIYHSLALRPQKSPG
jgi:hypothetical protein